jgi:ubiquinone/menaquinone biosynthesis C-methylase UbiE
MRRKDVSRVKKMPDFAFRIMSLIHDNPLIWIFRNPNRLLRAAGLKPGQKVLEVGCGPGFFTIPAAKIVGEWGVVYALDIHPLAVRKIQRKIKKNKISNVETILASVAQTGLPDKSVDIAFLFGFIHNTDDLEDILPELDRLLKPEGILSIEKTPWLSKKKLIKGMEKTKFIYISYRWRILQFTKEKI